ncbi:hypothetical protein OO013_05435 [Mangrovivirga sp. M17]|uniref:Class I SAM-dependent methyltransferase n=1 Tax=Mangrovivirga halotolerans TaxID=2993936 RepID=A0ABT3RNW0_9BACT|nr:hypothetical protein [Mangrovivirga halotolerans]MCX2743296.1 hypothetical protein [Mangrovivirga halotolerans]
MKRIHLFEFEDQSWFPGWLRKCLTRLIKVLHTLVKTEDLLTKELLKLLDDSQYKNIVDLCSGSGGPMPEVYKKLNKEEKISMTLTDLYPDKQAAKEINSNNSSLYYHKEPIDATQAIELKGIKTMISSFHHMKPQKALEILKISQNKNQPILIYEISDNSFPAFLWWAPIPLNIITCLFITPLVRPMTWQQLVFTYFIPIIPICFAWDGAVSNARTYTEDDLKELLSEIPDNNYKWEIFKTGKKYKKLCLKGVPK